MHVIDHTLRRSRYNCKLSVKREKKLPKPPKTENWEHWAVENQELAYWCVNEFFGRNRRVDKEHYYGEAFRLLVWAARNYDPQRPNGMGGYVTFAYYASYIIFQHLKCEHKQYRQRVRRMRFTSLSGAGDDDRSALDSLSAQGSGPHHLTDVRDQINTWMERAELPDKWERILRLLFWEDRTLTDVAAEYGCSTECIRQYRDRALGRLRDAAILWSSERYRS